jgi:hypothetical protein
MVALKKLGTQQNSPESSPEKSRQIKNANNYKNRKNREIHFKQIYLMLPEHQKIAIGGGGVLFDF